VAGNFKKLRRVINEGRRLLRGQILNLRHVKLQQCFGHSALGRFLRGFGNGFI
jgi:hypothetical protein